MSTPETESGEASPEILPGRDFPLRVPGFAYQDLHREERLARLDQVS